MGRVLLAYQPKEIVDHYFTRAHLKKLTENTETNPAALRRILKTVRDKGFASIESELDYGLVSVALPIFGPSGQIVAAANCSDVTNRFDAAAIMEKRLPTLRRAVRRIENMLAQFPELAASVTFDQSGRSPIAR
jgi:IclR family pca regulon transcriptional regulator